MPSISHLSDTELFDRVRHFVIDKIIPYERDPRVTAHGPTEDLRLELNQLAREAGLLSLHVAPEWGGMGLNQARRAVPSKRPDIPFWVQSRSTVLPPTKATCTC